MKVFIVGATGVLGRPVVRQLVAGGDEVVALVRSRQRAAAIEGPGVQIFEGDLLNEPVERLQTLMTGCAAAAHLATALRAGSPGLGTTNTNSALRTHGTRRLVDAALAAGVRRYVQQSIALAYIDGGDAWLDETTPFFQPEAAGGAAQPAVEMEAIVRAIDPARMAWIILRGGSFVGPATRQDQVIASLRDGSLRVPGDGSNWVSFIHVDDYADAVVAALRSPAHSLILNVADEPVRNGDYLDRLAAILGLPPPDRNLEARLPRSYRCTSAAARASLSWRPARGIWPAPDA
jgi:nucleoside-diphosphate-sugar epimerase